MGSASEDEDDDDPPHLRGPALGLGVLGPNGPDSAGGPLGTSDISVQSMSTDSKNTHDDSDQVSGRRNRNRNTQHNLLQLLLQVESKSESESKWMLLLASLTGFRFNSNTYTINMYSIYTK